MLVYIILALSIIINAFLVWYVVTLLRKFLFISSNSSDLFLTIKSFNVFVGSLYSMDSYHGEPIIQELMLKTKEVLEEMESYREIFEYTLDVEMEEELDAAQEKEE